MFIRDAVAIKDAADKSPEVTAYAVMFAVASANAKFNDTVNTLNFLKSRDITTLSFASLTVADRSFTATGLSTAKLAALQYIWRNRHSIHSAAQWLDATSFWHYLIDVVPGLGLVKAAFTVQLPKNELGCLDIHNMRDLGHTKVLRPQSAKDRDTYLRLQDSRTSEQWWDFWCNLYAEKYPHLYANGGVS